MLGIIGLALLATPRVVLHDLHVIQEGTFVNSLFVVIPPVLWIVTVLVLRVSRPIRALVSVGVLYGLLLAAGHLLLWDQAFPDGDPQLGGNLSDLAPWLQEMILRGFGALSSLITGTIIGAVTGLVAAGLSSLLGLRRRPAEQGDSHDTQR